MKIRAAKALAALVTDEQLSADYILPSALDKSVAATVAAAIVLVLILYFLFRPDPAKQLQRRAAATHA